MAVRLFSDSTSDLPKALQEQMDITVLPLIFSFDNEHFRQGIDISTDDFYVRLRAAQRLPKSTQVTPAAFEEALAPVVKAGDSVILFTLSGALSGTHESACQAAAAFPEAEIYVVDTRNVSVASQLLIFEAARMRDAGASAKEIHSEMLRLRPLVRLYAIISDLKYLVMGGRLPNAGAKVGSMLNLKPAITIEHDSGQVKMLGIARGMKRGTAWLVEKSLADGVDATYPIVFGHTGAPQLMYDLQAAFPVEQGQQVYLHQVGEVVGVHAGPGCMAVAFVAKPEK